MVAIFPLFDFQLIIIIRPTITFREAFIYGVRVVGAAPADGGNTVAFV